MRKKHRKEKVVVYGLTFHLEPKKRIKVSKPIRMLKGV